MSNSSLVEYINRTKKFSQRNDRISKITIHHSASVDSAKGIADYFAHTDRLASANYCIGVKGDIALSVDEEHRAWTSKSRENDSKAVTIEVSNSKASGNYPISDDTYESLIALCADICQRNGIQSVYYNGTQYGVLTEHRMFAATQCPGEYIHNLLKSGKIAKDINARINAGISYGNGYKYDGLDFEPIFNPDYYLKRYPDLANAGLHTADQLFQHFCQFGMSEARQANAIFSPVLYRTTNPDLDSAFDNDWECYYKHYLMFGRQEIEDGKRARFT